MVSVWLNMRRPHWSNGYPCVVPPRTDCSPDKVLSFLLFGKNKLLSEADLLHSVDKQ